MEATMQVVGYHLLNFGLCILLMGRIIVLAKDVKPLELKEALSNFVLLQRQIWIVVLT